MVRLSDAFLPTSTQQGSEAAQRFAGACVACNGARPCCPCFREKCGFNRVWVSTTKVSQVGLEKLCNPRMAPPVLAMENKESLHNRSGILNPLGMTENLWKTAQVTHIQKDWKVKRLTNTPKFLGLPSQVWPSGGGEERAGEGVAIDIIDTRIYPQHPSFSVHNSPHYGSVPSYTGKREVDPDTSPNFCNGKIVGAQHFAAAAIAAASFNPAYDFSSPLDGDGPGRYGFEFCNNDARFCVT